MDGPGMTEADNLGLPFCIFAPEPLEEQFARRIKARRILQIPTQVHCHSFKQIHQSVIARLTHSTVKTHPYNICNHPLSRCGGVAPRVPPKQNPQDTEIPIGSRG